MMYRLGFALLLSAAAAPAFAATKSFPGGGFDKVDLAAAAGVAIQSGSGFHITAEGDQRLLDRLDIRTKGDTLRIGWLPGPAMSLNHDEHLKIAITMPRVTGVTLSGAGSILVDRAEAATFSATMHGAGQITLPALHAQTVSLTMGGAGEIKAGGKANRVEARVDGVGSIDAGALVARSGRFDMGGTGSIKGHVDGPAEVNVGGMGSVRIFGKAACTTHKSGFGSVHCGD